MYVNFADPNARVFACDNDDPMDNPGWHGYTLVKIMKDTKLNPVKDLEEPAAEKGVEAKAYLVESTLKEVE